MPDLATVMTQMALALGPNALSWHGKEARQRTYNRDQECYNDVSVDRSLYTYYAVLVPLSEIYSTTGLLSNVIYVKAGYLALGHCIF